MSLTLQKALIYLCCAVFVNGLYGSTDLFGWVFGFKKLCFCRCGVNYNDVTVNGVRSARLVGEPSAPYRFPWIVLINTGSHQDIFGSLISDRHVISTAASLYGVPTEILSVKLGVHDRCSDFDDHVITVGVETVIIHPAFSKTSLYNDVGLLRMRHRVAFNQFVSPICMPFLGHDESDQIAWVAGWEDFTSNRTCVPRVGVVPILSTSSCAKGTTTIINKGCLGPIGTRSIISKNDVGAPVMWRWTEGAAFRLIGVVSSVPGSTEMAPLYTRVADYALWIQHYIRTDCQCF